MTKQQQAEMDLVTAIINEPEDMMFTVTTDALPQFTHEWHTPEEDEAKWN
jgi:hypothetical protein